MTYRERLEEPESVRRVELGRFVPQPWYTHTSALWLVACVLLSGTLVRALVGAPFSLLAASLSLGIMLAAWLVALYILWPDAASLVLRLERDARARRVVVERSLGPIVLRRAYPTDEPLALDYHADDEFSLVNKQWVRVHSVSLRLGPQRSIKLFSSVSESEAARFSAAMQRFDERAAAVPGATEIRERSAQQQQRDEQAQRARDERYRAWFDEVIAEDHREGLIELLDRGFSIDRPLDLDGSTALDLAVRRGATRCAQLLIERGAKSAAVPSLREAQDATSSEAQPAAAAFERTGVRVEERSARDEPGGRAVVDEADEQGPKASVKNHM